MSNAKSSGNKSRSIFRDFITALRRHWKLVLPCVTPVGVSYPAAGPKASTFHAGIVPATGQHVFLHFQHNSQAWNVGQFTVNVMLSKSLPPIFARTFHQNDWKTLKDGKYRIGLLMPSTPEGSPKDKWTPENKWSPTDKWWHLREDEASVLTKPWYASDYTDKSLVIGEAVADVTNDVCALLDRLGIERRGAPEVSADDPTPRRRW